MDEEQVNTEVIDAPEEATMPVEVVEEVQASE